MKKLKIVIDHDAGTNPDDILAMLFLLNMPDIDILMTLSGNNHPVERARYMRHFLSLAGKGDIPCFAGEEMGHIAFYGHDAIKESTFDPPFDYITALKNMCEQNDHIVYLAIQGLSNLNRFIMAHPQCSDKLSIYHMGMTLNGADKDYITGGTNIEADPLAAKSIYERNDLSLWVVGSHTTIHDQLRITPQTALHQKLACSDKPHYQMAYQALLEFYNRRGIWPALHDPLTASVAVGKDFVRFTEKTIGFAENGQYKLNGKTQIRISDCADYEAFMDYFVSVLQGSADL